MMAHEQLFLNGAPIVGFGGAPVGFGLGQVEAVAPAVATTAASPWTLALTTSMVSAATGWAIQEIAQAVRRRRR